ncbi:MAG: transaldolase family protein, partial [Phycisphaeraceae bacterium]|nr:transaldolase family protein [Phycisphaeraceae bacterium]
MTRPLDSLLNTGTTLWLDSVDPDLLDRFVPMGVTGATSNPKIIEGLLSSGRFDDAIRREFEKLDTDEQVAWAMTDRLVADAQQRFRGIWEQTQGNDGYVSFELDPLLEDPDADYTHEQRVTAYVDLARRWSADQPNRMIKVPATPAGLDALEELAAAGVTMNVTLIFTERQYQAARDAV